MGSVIALACLFPIAAALRVPLRYRFEQALPVGCFGIILVLYISGLFGRLDAGVYLCYLLGALALVFCTFDAVKKWKSGWLSDLLTPGFIAFCVFVIFIFWAHWGRVISLGDEFAHWGYVVKTMFHHDQFGYYPGILARYSGYPPGCSLFLLFFVKGGATFSEAGLYHGMNVLCVSLVLPYLRHFGRAQWKRAALVFGVLFLLPMAVADIYYMALHVDALLGVLFAYLLYTWFGTKKKDAPLLINLCLGLFVLTLENHRVLRWHGSQL